MAFLRGCELRSTYTRGDLDRAGAGALGLRLGLGFGLSPNVVQGVCLVCPCYIPSHSAFFWFDSLDQKMWRGGWGLGTGGPAVSVCCWCVADRWG